MTNTAAVQTFVPDFDMASVISVASLASFDEVVQAFADLDRLGRRFAEGFQWVIGDLSHRATELRQDEDVAAVLADLAKRAGRSVSTLKAYRSIAGKYAWPERNLDVPWTVHQKLAPFHDRDKLVKGRHPSGKPWTPENAGEYVTLRNALGNTNTERARAGLPEYKDVKTALRAAESAKSAGEPYPGKCEGTCPVGMNPEVWTGHYSKASPVTWHMNEWRCEVCVQNITRQARNREKEQQREASQQNTPASPPSEAPSFAPQSPESNGEATTDQPATTGNHGEADAPGSLRRSEALGPGVAPEGSQGKQQPGDEPRERKRWPRDKVIDSVTFNAGTAFTVTFKDGSVMNYNITVFTLDADKSDRIAKVLASGFSTRNWDALDGKIRTHLGHEAFRPNRAKSYGPRIDLLLNAADDGLVPTDDELKQLRHVMEKIEDLAKDKGQ